MCDFERYNIKVVEGNAFTLLLPLKSRTFVASRPVDEDIVIEDLENLRVFVNNTEYSSVRQESDGVAIDFPATLKQGDYDVVLNATYHGVDIRAAYDDAVIIVAWNQQSDAQQYVQGSPFVLPAAYVLGVMSDAELEALKAQLRLEIAAAQQAKEEAEQAKEEYIAKAEALDDVAQQTTLTQGVQDIREDISHIDIDTSNLAKQGSDAGATLTDTQAAAQSILAKVQQVIDAKILTLSIDGYVWQQGHEPSTNKLSAVIQQCRYINTINDDYTTTYDDVLATFIAANLTNVTVANFTAVQIVQGSNSQTGAGAVIYNFPNATVAALNGRAWQTNERIQELHMPNVTSFSQASIAALNSASLIDIELGAISTSFNISSWKPYNAMSSTSSSLIKPDEPFTNNLEKLLYNIRNHIAANLPDRTGLSALTVTFHANVKAAIQADTATANAFSNKNWTIA